MYPHSFTRKMVTNEFRFKPGMFGKIIIEQKIIIKTYKGIPPVFERDIGIAFNTEEKWQVLDYGDLIEQNLINVTMVAK